ncbi:MAG: hypothetical protein E7507_05595 [Ruminococcus sp.]|nr:hypothetical protein [Ruminococcus sp.]
MLYKMNVKEIATAYADISTIKNNFQDIHQQFVDFINEFSDIQGNDAISQQFFDEAVEYMKKFERCKEDMEELMGILYECISMTQEAENEVANYMTQLISEKEVVPTSRYDAYLHHRNQYNENYEKWTEKNFNVKNVIGSAINDIFDENIVRAGKDLLSGESMVSRIETENIKKILHSAIQNECQSREFKWLNDGIEKDIMDVALDSRKTVNYGKDIGEFVVKNTLSESQMNVMAENMKLTPEAFGKFLKYGKMSGEYTEYLMNDYSENMEYLDSLKTAFSEVSNPAVVENVINELERQYTDKFFEVADKLVDDGLDIASDKLTDTLMELTPGTQALKLVIDGAELLMDATGASKNMDNWSEIVRYNNNFQGSMDNAINNYLDKFNDGTASMQDIKTLNTLIDIDTSAKQIMYDKMSVANNGLASDFEQASDALSKYQQLY